jgi:hypothetical protein
VFGDLDELTTPSLALKDSRLGIDRKARDHATGVVRYHRKEPDPFQRSTRRNGIGLALGTAHLIGAGLAPDLPRAHNGVSQDAAGSTASGGSAPELVDARSHEYLTRDSAQAARAERDSPIVLGCWAATQ